MSCCFHSVSRGLRLPGSGESRDWCYNGNPLTRCASPQTPSPSPAAQESEIAWLQKALQSQQLRVYLHLTVSILRRWTFNSNSQHHLKTQTFVGIIWGFMPHNAWLIKIDLLKILSMKLVRRETCSFVFPGSGLFSHLSEKSLLLQ